MKIKIWQQFSSNHSADFMLIGEFKTTKEAKQATDEINRIIDYIVKWWRSHNVPPGTDITPPEREIQEKYELEQWSSVFHTGVPVRVDWINYARDYEPVYHFRNLLFIANYGQTWLGPTSFNYILEKLGAKVSSGVPGYQSDVPYMTISFTLPDKENTVYHDIRYSYFLTPPWRKGGRWQVQLPHIPGLITSPRMENDQDVYKLWDNLIDGGYIPLYNGPDGNSEDCFEALMAIDSLGFEIEHGYRSDCDVMEELSWKLRCKNYQQFSSIHRDNNHVTVRGFDPGENGEIGDRFAEFIYYLEKNGCTDIEWEIFGHEDVVGRE